MTKLMKTVLILDDDKLVRESLVYYFEDQGWHVLSATTGEEALKVIDQNPPDGAIVDIRLPGMDGTAFIRQAKALHPEVVYVIYTGSPEYNLPADVAACQNVSEVALSKPLRDLSQLEEALLQLINRCDDTTSPL